jgi:hypothetical protein
MSTSIRAWLTPELTRKSVNPKMYLWIRFVKAWFLWFIGLKTYSCRFHLPGETGEKPDLFYGVVDFAQQFILLSGDV